MFKKLLIFLIVVISLPFLGISQIDTVWTHSYPGSYVVTGLQTNDGYIFSGLFDEDETKNTGIIIIKTYDSGDTAWTKKYFFNCDISGVTWIDSTDNNNFIIAASFDEWAPDPYDVILLKINNYGDTLWTKKYSSTVFTHDDISVVRQIKYTTDNGFIMYGYEHEYGVNSNRTNDWILKTDETGDTLWIKNFGKNKINSLIELEDGYLAGGSNVYYLPDTGIPDDKYDAYLIKLDNQGDTLWTKTFHLTDQNYIKTIFATKDGGYLLGGRSYPLKEWLIELDSDFDTEWISSFLCPVFGHVIESRNGGFVFLGGSNALKMNTAGDTLWNVNFDCQGYNIKQTRDGGFIIFGDLPGLSGGSKLVKLSPDITSIKNDNTKNTINFELEQNFPNPFNPKTMIRWQLAASSPVNLSIYNSLGQKICTLISEKQSAGQHFAEWDASGFSSGIYYYQLQSGQNTQVKKMLYIK